MKALLIFTFIFLGNLTNLPALSCCNEPACWQGFYINGQLGAGWNKQNARFTNANYFNTLGPDILGNKFSFRSQGFVGGGAAGYNAQCGCWVLGLDAGALGVNLKETRASPLFPDLDTFSSRLNWIAFTKLRAGYAYNCFLPFLTGGWAGGKVSMLLNDPGAGISARARDWANGWTLGAGCDYKLTQCLSLGIAYDYIHLHYRHKETDCPNCSSGIGFGTPRISNNVHTHIAVIRCSIHL